MKTVGYEEAYVAFVQARAALHEWAARQEDGEDVVRAFETVTEKVERRVWTREEWEKDAVPCMGVLMMVVARLREVGADDVGAETLAKISDAAVVALRASCPLEVS